MSKYPVFQSHLDLAPLYWEKILRPGDWAIDATCGNGHDTLTLARLVKGGCVIALDLQQDALTNSQIRLQEHLHTVHFFQQCHCTFPELASCHPIRLIVYNLGYLPGGDKTKTTRVETTLASIKMAQSLLQAGGIISLTCYPGHPEGKKELDALLSYLGSLSPYAWNIMHHVPLNKPLSPSLILIQKSLE